MAANIQRRDTGSDKPASGDLAGRTTEIRKGFVLELGWVPIPAVTWFESERVRLSYGLRYPGVGSITGSAGVDYIAFAPRCSVGRGYSPGVGR